MPAFPSTILASEIVAWFDGSRTQYTDSGGLIAAGPGDLVRRVGQASPLADYWRATTDAQRTRRSLNAARFDIFGTAYPGTSLDLGSIPALTSRNNATIVASFLTRDGYGGPNMGLCASGAPNWGLFGGSSGAGVYVNGGNWQAFGVNTVARGVKTTFTARYGSAQVRAQLFAAGVTQTATNIVAVTSGTLGSPLTLGWIGAGCQGQYGEIGQAIVIDRQLTDLETADLQAWCDAQPLPTAFPLNQPLVGIVGDSIARAGVGVTTEESWWGDLLGALRTGAYPGAEVLNAAIVGSGAGLTAYTDQLQAFMTTGRTAKQIAVVATGTNNLANGQTAASVLTQLYALCDLIRADGVLVVLCDILPRQGLFNSPGNQTVFDLNQPLVNADIAANWHLHADGYVNQAAIAGLNNPANTTYYQIDKVHTTVVGNTAQSAPIIAEVVRLLSPTAVLPATRKYALPGGAELDTNDDLSIVSVEGLTLQQPLALGRFIEYWKHKPNIAGLSDSYMREVQALENAMWETLISRTIDYAVGVQLDTLGRLVGQPRGALTDPQYRVRIRVRIKINSSNGTAKDIIDILRSVDPAPFTYTEIYGGFRIDYTTAPSSAAVASQIPAIVRESRSGGFGGYVYMPVADARSLRWASIYGGTADAAHSWGSIWASSTGGLWAHVSKA